MDLGEFLNEAFKTVGHHGWPEKKIFCQRVPKNCLKLDFQGIKYLRIMQLSPGVLPSPKCFNFKTPTHPLPCGQHKCMVP